MRAGYCIDKIPATYLEATTATGIVGSTSQNPIEVSFCWGILSETTEGRLFVKMDLSCGNRPSTVK
jgi:hypothetical protein